MLGSTFQDAFYLSACMGLQHNSSVVFIYQLPQVHIYYPQVQLLQLPLLLPTAPRHVDDACSFVSASPCVGGGQDRG